MKTIHVDFNTKKGDIKPLHGVNNGPKSYGFQMDNSAYFKEAGIPYARLHDTEYPLGSGYFVDVPAIFKNFDKDAKDPASYDFRLTDEYLKSIKACGTDIIYRLGVTIENEAGTAGIVSPTYINPPEDFEKWSQICAGIIRHYNEGWADGFHMNIQYWEIWNEPESEAMWTGTREEFYELYTTAACYLKREFPDVKIGGFGSIGFYPYTRIDQPCFCDEPYISLLDYIQDFLTHIRKKNAPLDFFSWHVYSDDPKEYAIHAKAARKILDMYGFTETESLLDEWNFQSTRGKARTNCCSALIAAVLSVLQDNAVDIANYYVAQPRQKTWCGIFDGEKPLKGFFALKAFNLLYQMGTQVAVEAETGLYGCAARKDHIGGIMLTNYQNGLERVAVEVSGFCKEDGIEVQIYAVDANHDFELVRTERLTGQEYTLYINPAEDAVLYIELRKMEE